MDRMKRTTCENCGKEFLVRDQRNCRNKGSDTQLRIMSLVGNCKFNYFVAQMTTHGAA
jgi:RNase P subunit RPR2